MTNKYLKSVYIRFYSFGKHNEWECAIQIPRGNPALVWTYHISASKALARVDELIKIKRSFDAPWDYNG